MEANHPLRKAYWLWPIEVDTPRNFYVQYRCDISLKAVGRKAPFFVTADQCYMLYVNGQYVCRGPARGYQSSWPYDEVDLVRYLKVGHNWISARVYNAGISTFQYLHQSTGGFLCAAKWGKVEIYSGLNWLERPEPGYRKDTARLSFSLNYQEWTNARKDDQCWITSARLPRGDGWSKPRTCRPFGVMPWHKLEERGIPNLTNDILPYQKTVSTSSGKCSGNWQNQSNLYVPAYTEIKRAAWSTAKSGRRARSGLTFMLPKAGAGRFVSVSADLGKPGFGSLIVQAEGAIGGETIRAVHGTVQDAFVDAQIVLVRPERVFGIVDLPARALAVSPFARRNQSLHLPEIRRRAPQCVDARLQDQAANVLLPGCRSRSSLRIPEIDVVVSDSGIRHMEVGPETRRPQTCRQNRRTFILGRQHLEFDVAALRVKNADVLAVLGDLRRNRFEFYESGIHLSRGIGRQQLHNLPEFPFRKMPRHLVVRRRHIRRQTKRADHK